MRSLAAGPDRSPRSVNTGARAEIRWDQWRSVALPAEHGSWGLVAEPVLLGLLVAFSPVALLVGLGSFAGFLAHRPLKLAYGDHRRGRRYPRTALAELFATGFAVLAVACFGGAVALAGTGLALPLVLALPLAAAFLIYDLRPGRSWQAELAAPAAFASAVAAMALGSGWSLGPALALWAAMAARSVPTVLYVRERVRLERSGALRASVALAAVGGHAVALAAVLMLGQAALLPGLAVLAFVLLTLRTLHGLSPVRSGHTARSVGFQEIAWGVLTVVLVVVGFWGLG